MVRAADCRSAGPWFKSGCALLFACCFCSALFAAIARSVFFAAEALLGEPQQRTACRRSTCLGDAAPRLADENSAAMLTSRDLTSNARRDATGRPRHVKRNNANSKPRRAQTNIKTRLGPTRHPFANRTGIKQQPSLSSRRTKAREPTTDNDASCGVRTHAQLPAVDLKSTPLTTRAN